MTDLEKVVRGLEGMHRCISPVNHSCGDCPYQDNHVECERRVINDAITLLKEQQETITSFQSAINKQTKALAEQPEQKHGHWVLDPDGMDWNLPAWKCSMCACRNDNIPPNLEKANPLRWSGSKFCPNCGAKMDEEVKQDG